MAAGGSGMVPLFAFGAGTGTGTGSAAAAIGPQPSKQTPRRRAGLRISLSATLARESTKRTDFADHSMRRIH
jgi:hypothetical protein